MATLSTKQRPKHCLWKAALRAGMRTALTEIMARPVPEKEAETGGDKCRRSWLPPMRKREDMARISGLASKVFLPT